MCIKNYFRTCPFQCSHSLNLRLAKSLEVTWIRGEEAPVAKDWPCGILCMINGKACGIDLIKRFPNSNNFRIYVTSHIVTCIEIWGKCYVARNVLDVWWDEFPLRNGQLKKPGILTSMACKQSEKLIQDVS